MRMYGFAWSMGWPCICFGKKSWFFKLYYGKAIKRFRFQHWIDDTKTVWWQRVNSYPIIFDEEDCIVDGAHRLVHAYLDGVKTIKGVVIANKQWPKPFYDETTNNDK